MWASEITEIPAKAGTFLWGSGHDAKDEEPNLDLFLLQLRETEARASGAHGVQG